MTDTNGKAGGIGNIDNTMPVGNMPDITALDVPALLALRTAIIARIQELQATGVSHLKQQFLEQARALGVTPEEVMGLAPGKKRGRKPKHESSP